MMTRDLGGALLYRYGVFARPIYVRALRTLVLMALQAPFLPPSYRRSLRSAL